jgi:hypothetical protein
VGPCLAFSLFAAIKQKLSSLPAHLRRLWHPSIGTQIIFDNADDAIRIPHDGDGKNGQPNFYDTPYFRPLDEAVGIGVNGWDWSDQVSVFVTFDLDSITNHGEGLSPEKLAAIVEKLKAVPWVEIIRSKSGQGYHVRAYFDPMPRAATHTDHARNAERVLAYLSKVTGLDLTSDVDVCGAVAWIFYRDTAPNGFKLLKAASQKIDLSATPEIPRVERKQERVNRGPKHREHIAWMAGKGYGEWDEQAGCLNTHTRHVAEMCEEFNLPGEFETVATGKEGAKGRNCALFPIRKGAWLCVRYQTAKEGPTWKVNERGHAYCFVGKAEPKQKADPADLIVSEALKQDKFFSWEGVAYVQVTRRGKEETLLVGSDTYARLLRVRYRKAHHQVAKGEWIRNAIDQLIATAIEEGEEIPVYVRIAYLNGKLYIDLVDRERNIVEVDADGFRIIKEAPVRFLRTDRMLALPIPQPGGKLEDLRQFVNIEDQDFPLLIGAIIGALHPTGPYPIVSLIGGDGRAKTCLAIVLLMLVDPSIVKGCSPPEKNEDLILAVQQKWIYFIDNLDEIKGWLSDSLCRLSTGGTTERRTLYKNSDTSFFRAKRPVILTSIKDVVTAPDLNSRTLKFDLPRVGNHKLEAELWADFEKARPQILGALYTAVSAAIKNLPHTKLDNLPRLADFCLWVQAAESATGLKQGSILETYRQAREAAVSELLSADVAQKVLAFATPEGWQGTGKELAIALELLFARDRDIQDFVSELRSIQTALDSQGVLIGFRKTNGRKLITIKNATAKTQ